MLTILCMSYDTIEPWWANARPEIVRSAAAKPKQIDTLCFTLPSAGKSPFGISFLTSQIVVLIYVPEALPGTANCSSEQIISLGERTTEAYRERRAFCYGIS